MKTTINKKRVIWQNHPFFIVKLPTNVPFYHFFHIENDENIFFVKKVTILY